MVNVNGVTDHTALLPMKNKALVDFEKLTENERKVLELVYQNLEEATSKPYKYEKTTVKISYRGEVFTANGVRNLELGWKKDRPDETKEQLLPEFQKGDKVVIEDVYIEKRQTEAPERFTDGKLLQAMENAGKESTEQDPNNSGIGTSATRAEILEKLVSGGYVERVGDGDQPYNFVPTELAYSLDKVLPESLKSAEMTAKWETKLAEVEAGKLKSEEFMKEIQEFIRNIIKV